MIKVCVKVNGWRRHKLHDIISFSDNMFKELKQAEKLGMISIISEHKPDIPEFKPKVFSKFNVNIKKGDNNGT